ncbi:MAG: type II toxin-antitoxin system HicA family toxin [Rubrobacteraceae bacterium]
MKRRLEAKFVRRDDEGTRTAIAPRHREVAAGTLRSILRQASIPPEEFERL